MFFFNIIKLIIKKMLNNNFLFKKKDKYYNKMNFL